MSRRRDFDQFYRQPRNTRTGLVGALANLRKAAISDEYSFHGEKTELTAVVRVDLNGYSEWAESRELSERKDLLDEFFSSVLPILHSQKGIYFRDEGDCVVALFSNYFELGASWSSIRQFCKDAVSLTFGGDLTAKAVISVGNVAFFQKAHEEGTDDWSAEGEAFVRAVRLEAGVASAQCVYFFKDEYENYFANTAPIASGSEPAYWTLDSENIQVSGLGAPGGWVEVMKIERK